MNVTSWGNGSNAALATAPVVAIQEHKLRADRLEEVSAQLKRSGRHMVGSPAILGPKGGSSAGVALMFQSHIDAWHPESTTYTPAVWWYVTVGYLA